MPLGRATDARRAVSRFPILEALRQLVTHFARHSNSTLAGTMSGNPTAKAPQGGLSPAPAAQPTIEVDNGAGVWPPGLRRMRPATPSDDEVSTAWNH